MEPCDPKMPGLIFGGLPVVLEEVEGAVSSCIDLHLESAPRQGTCVLHHGRQRQHCSCPDEGWHLVEGRLPTHVRRPMDNLQSIALTPWCLQDRPATSLTRYRGPRDFRGAQRIPCACRKINLPPRMLVEDWRDKDSSIHPLGGDVSGHRVVRKFHDQWAHPEEQACKHCVRQRIMVGNEPIAELQSLPHSPRCLVSPEPRPMGHGLQTGVHPHRRHENAHLHPPREELRRGVSLEAADVASHIGGARKDPIQHHTRCAHEVLPCGIDFPRPDSRPKSCHARRPSPVERIKPLAPFGEG
mmetsp:Transcript_95029/g.204024  ORF Transcript_95029/g.204024 Transcript_95029/m.204024 type:complete len:299 (-) Transcript_95029:855-1751(-)